MAFRLACRLGWSSRLGSSFHITRSLESTNQQLYFSSFSSLSCSSSSSWSWFNHTQPTQRRQFVSNSLPNLHDRLDELWNESKELLRENKTKEAVSLLEDAAIKEPEGENLKKLFFRLADIHLATSQYQHVVDVCDRAIEQCNLRIFEEEGEKMVSIRGEAYERAGNYQRAKEDYKTVLASNPDNIEILQRLGFMELEHLRVDPTNIETKLREVESIFDTCISHEPEDPELYYGGGLVGVYLSEFEKAIEMFEKSTKIDEGYAPAWQKLAYTQIARKNWVEAVFAIDKFLHHSRSYFARSKLDIKINLDHVLHDVMLKRGLCYLMLEDYDMALTSFDVLTDPKISNVIPVKMKAQALAGKGNVYLKKKEYWECVTQSSEAIALDESLYDAYQNRYEAYVALNLDSLAESDKLQCFRMQQQMKTTPPPS